MRELKLNGGWLAARAGDISQTGEELTTSHVPSIGEEPWMEAVVPGTILTTLLKNKKIPDPFYGLQNENIPDIADAGREYYTFWFSISFNLLTSGQERAWLKFRAINYSADVFVNGHKKSLPGGMFLRHLIDITDWLNADGSTYVAVLVHPPDHPGRIPVEGGQGGDHDIAKDVAAQYVEGWDWMTPIRDRNTGIWDDVAVSVTGPVLIQDPHLVTTFYDDFTRAYLHTSVALKNTSSIEEQVTIRIQVIFDNMEETFSSIEHVQSQVLSIAAGSTFIHRFPPLLFLNPLLWWPNGAGEQPLYVVEITVSAPGMEESDEYSQRLGFRHIESHIDSHTGGRTFVVNGEPIFIRGGNWIVSDGLLRLSEKRYKTDIGFHADMNLNMIRVWGGGLAERPAFYDACDERGILVWQEFWITGDCNGRGLPPSDCSWPLDHDLFLRCARDTVKLLRNHASLVLWVGGNEQFPPPDINDVLESELSLHPSLLNSNSQDHVRTADFSAYLDGTRPYVKGSLWSGFAAGDGRFTDGPYGIQNPEDYFKDGFYLFAFNPEVGNVGVPVASTIRATMPPEAWEPPEVKITPDGYLQEIPNPTWEYHKYIPYSDPQKKVNYQIGAYGTPADLDDFCEKAQLVNFVQYRALIESWNSRMWTQYTGVLIWKTQNPWPGLRGNLYDHCLEQTAGFFGVRTAAEPIHIQLNLATSIIEIVNSTGFMLENNHVETTIWGLEGVNLYSNYLTSVSLNPHKTVSVFEVPFPDFTSSQSVYFLVLHLKDFNGKELSRNFYWLHAIGQDYSLLQGEFQAKKVPVRVSASSKHIGRLVHATLNIINTSHTKDSHQTPLENCVEETEMVSGVAFWLHLSVTSTKEEGQLAEDNRVLPVTYSQNYFSLVPRESITVEISFEYDKQSLPMIILKGWNVDPIYIKLEGAS